MIILCGTICGEKPLNRWRFIQINSKKNLFAIIIFMIKFELHSKFPQKRYKAWMSSGFSWETLPLTLGSSLTFISIPLTEIFRKKTVRISIKYSQTPSLLNWNLNQTYGFRFFRGTYIHFWVESKHQLT